MSTQEIDSVSRADLQERSSYLLAKAQAARFDQAEVELSFSTGFSVSARLGQLELLEKTTDQSLSFTVYNQHRSASVDSTDWSFSALDRVFEKASSLVKYVQEDQFQGLANAAELAFSYPDLDLYHPGSLSAREAVDTAIAMDQAACAYDPRVLHSDGCSVSSASTHVLYANSNGFSGDYRYTRHGLSHSVVVEDDSGKQTYSDYDVNCLPAALNDPQALSVHVAQEACRRLQPRKVATQKCPVLFAPTMAKKKVGTFISAINGHRVYRQSSFLNDKQGELIFPEWMSLVQKPHLKRSLFSAPFDDEGVVTREFSLLDLGRFDRYLCDSYASRRLGLPMTGTAGGVFNVSLTTQGVSFSQLVKQMHQGLLVTDMMGQGVNFINGDFSKGASGFWVEDGEITFPVDGVTIAANLRDMYAGCVANGNDVDRRGSLQIGSLLINSMTVSGT